MAFLRPIIASLGFMCMWNAIQHKIPAPLVQVLSVANMLVPIIVGTLFLKEVLCTRQMVGVVLMLLGCSVAVFRGTLEDDDYPALQLWNCFAVALTFGIATTIIFVVGKRISERDTFVCYGVGTLPLFVGVLIAVSAQGKDHLGLHSRRGFAFTVAGHVLNQMGTVSSTFLSQK